MGPGEEIDEKINRDEDLDDEDLQWIEDEANGEHDD